MASLVISHGAAIGENYKLAEGITSVGRDDDCTIQVLDERVSRKHLQIRFDELTRTFVAGDYRSANGVFINEKQILADVVLNDGDRIRIGDTNLIFFLADFPDKASAHAAVKKAGEWAKDTLTQSKMR
ncbi:MAG: FHA domain-containing protein [Phycisphaerales bacterium]|nr:FHA domain-containing protein [Planctomycetota bacterium]